VSPMRYELGFYIQEDAILEEKLHPVFTRTNGMNATALD
jgi:hypothetical protein